VDDAGGGDHELRDGGERGLECGAGLDGAAAAGTGDGAEAAVCVEAADAEGRVGEVEGAGGAEGGVRDFEGAGLGGRFGFLGGQGVGGGKRGEEAGVCNQ
jgi:hypothetical protein